MAKITVWSKQHENVWKVLQETGRYTVKREYIIKDLKEHSELVLDTYEWLVKNGPDYGNKPADVEFPVWVSFMQDATIKTKKGRKGKARFNYNGSFTAIFPTSMMKVMNAAQYAEISNELSMNAGTGPTTTPEELAKIRDACKRYSWFSVKYYTRLTG